MDEVCDHQDRVFPTPVGMNRDAHHILEGRIRVPHARGDEPGM